MSKDQAARIALREYATDAHSEDHEVAHANAYRPRLERAIRRAISAAVRKERERCARCAFDIRIKELREHSTRVGAFVADDIITAINGGKR